MLMYSHMIFVITEHTEQNHRIMVIYCFIYIIYVIWHVDLKHVDTKTTCGLNCENREEMM